MATGRVPTTANSPLTAKGDLFTYSTAPARLAVGSNGESLVADSSTSTGLRYTSLFGANKNVFLNADFRINQRGFTSTTSSATYGFDRWRTTMAGGTITYSAQTFTPGAAPVAGYEAINYARLVTTGQSAASDRAVLNQLVEDVRVLSGQTVTVSFWAQAGSGTPKVNVILNQNFGTGGSSSVNASVPTAQTISTSWARYSFTFANPSVSGKTISATDSRSNVQIYVSDGGDFGSGVGAQNNTFNIWGVQMEAGSVATPFATATGTIQGELDACCRYYEKNQGAIYVTAASGGLADSYATSVYYKVEKRAQPTLTIFSSGNQGGTSGSATWYGGGTGTVAAAAQESNTETQFTIRRAGVSTSTFAIMSYTSSAEL
jgi:hypothetical protein